MELPNDIPTVMQNAARYFMLHGETIPEYQREKLVQLMGPGVSPVDFVVKMTEILYAVADDLDADGKDVVAQGANLAAMNGWHDMPERGNKIVNAIKRKKGEEVAQAEDDDPEPKKEHYEPQEALVPETPVPPENLELEEGPPAPPPVLDLNNVADEPE